MKTIKVMIAAYVLAMSPLAAEEISQAEVDTHQREFDAVTAQGRAAFTDGKLGANGVVCAQCHPNGANTHPETYPKFQKQLGKVAQLWEMVNWCIQNPLEGKTLAADDPKMTALLAYMAWERRGVALQPGKR
jgi:thiosulfate dehydrogenase